jgi:SAM-dependent methyltransferase
MKTSIPAKHVRPWSSGSRIADRLVDHEANFDYAGLHEIHRCEVCGTAALRSVLALGAHPLCDDLVPINDARVCREYPIEILFCDTCVTAHQRFQVPKRDLFPRDYHYRARQTLDVLNGMRDLVNACATRFGDLRGKKVLDIGCNDGSLLSIFAECGALTYGIEPTGAAMDAAVSGHQILNAFFDEGVAKEFVALYGQPDIITFTNVFAHIEDLPDVIRGLNALSNPRTKIVIENHYIGSIISGRQFDTFYHEHPRTYSASSFRFIARALGMFISQIEFPKRYGGNIRVFLSGAWDSDQPSRSEPALFDRERHYSDDISQLSEQISRWHGKKAVEIGAAVRRCGPLSAKAFPGRAAIPIKLLGLDQAVIEAVYEKPGSGKIGHYVPGTRIPILSDDAFPEARRSTTLVNMAWHIADEIEAYLRARGFGADIIRIIAPGDFTA